MTFAANLERMTQADVRLSFFTSAGIQSVTCPDQWVAIGPRVLPANTQNNQHPIFEESSGVYSRVWTSWKEVIDGAIVRGRSDLNVRRSNTSQDNNYKIRLFVKPTDGLVLGAEIVDALSDLNNNNLGALLCGAGVFSVGVDFLCGDEDRIYLLSPTNSLPPFVRETASMLQELRHSARAVALDHNPPLFVGIDRHNERYLKNLLSNLWREIKATVDMSGVWPFMDAFLKRTKEGKRDITFPQPPHLPDVWITLDDEGRIVGHMIRTGLNRAEESYYEKDFFVGHKGVKVSFQEYLRLAFPIQSHHTRVWALDGKGLNRNQQMAMKHLLMRTNMNPPHSPEGWVVSAISDGRIVA